MNDEIRINATDLARLIGERDDYERAVERAQSADKEWRAALDDSEERYRRFHRAVQETLGWDQAKLLPEGQLLERITVLTGDAPAPDPAEHPAGALLPLRMVRADDLLAGKGFETPPESIPWAVDDLIEHQPQHLDKAAFRGRVTCRVQDPGYDGIWWDVVVTEILHSPIDTAGVMVGQSLRLREDSPAGVNRRLGGLEMHSPAWTPDDATGPPTESMPPVQAETTAEDPAP